MGRRILIVDDDAEVLDGLEALLTAEQWDVVTADCGAVALERFEAKAPGIVLLDVMLPDISGLEVLDRIKEMSESTPVVMMSGVGTVEAAVRAMKAGAETFIAKPYDIETLEAVLEHAQNIVETRREIVALRRSVRRGESSFPGLSAAARELEAVIGKVAPASSPVLLEGETGSGKGFVARMIHDRSPRSKKPMVDLNCAGLSRELLESELFGHERGAFTDATSAKQGLFEIASDGTVFLDEIAEMEQPVQARLLKAIEDRSFRRVGGVREIRSDFRLIAATNRDLDEEVREGRFRKDLFYRLNVVRIRIPPLRERKEDIRFLAESILDSLAREMALPGRHLSDRAMERLIRYRWPGNVRELRNVLERTLLLSEGPEIRADDLILEALESRASGSEYPGDESEIRPLDEVTNEYIERAVAASGGNIRGTARRLGISPSTLYARRKKRG